MDTSQLPHAKPKPSKRAHPDAALDRRESAKVRKRSEGRCEVREHEIVARAYDVATMAIVDVVVSGRCLRRAVHVMHLIGGNGKRGVGISALAIHKLHGCSEHHREIDGDIGGKKLIRVGGTVPLWTDPYRRVR